MNTITLKKNLMWSGIIYTIILVLWPVFMILSKLSPDFQVQIELIKSNAFLFKMCFIIASLISPAILWIMYLFVFQVKSKVNTPTLNKAGYYILVVYALFISISYVSQFTYLIKLINSDKFNLAKDWYFGNMYSRAYFFNQIGYFFFALGGLLIGYRFLYEKSVLRWFGILVEVSSILSVFAFVGFIIRSEGLNSLTAISGFFIVPLGILATLYSRKVIV